MKYDKLVRDKIHEIIAEEGKTAVTHVASDKEYLQRLNKKLVEEVNEFIQSKDKEELADILEVIRAICDARHINFKDIDSIRKEKMNKRGGFKKRIVLDEVK